MLIPLSERFAGHQAALAGADIPHSDFVTHDDDGVSPLLLPENGLDEASAKGWTEVSMKGDWKTISPARKGMNRFQQVQTEVTDTENEISVSSCPPRTTHNL